MHWRPSVLAGTYPRKESSLSFFLNFLLPLLPLWLNVQFSSLQHPSWSEEFPFPELRFPRKPKRRGFLRVPGLKKISSGPSQVTSWLLYRFSTMLSAAASAQSNLGWTTFNKGTTKMNLTSEVSSNILYTRHYGHQDAATIFSIWELA